MKSKFIELGRDDTSAREHILESLSVCAHDHVLSRKLFTRLSSAIGQMFAIIGEWFDLNLMTTYDYTVAAPEGDYSDGERPTERLARFHRTIPSDGH